VYTECSGDSKGGELKGGYSPQKMKLPHPNGRCSIDKSAKLPLNNDILTLGIFFF